MKAILVLAVLGSLVPPLMATGPGWGSVGETVKPQKRYPTVYTIVAAPRRPRLSDVILNPPVALARWLIDRYIDNPNMPRIIPPPR